MSAAPDIVPQPLPEAGLRLLRFVASWWIRRRWDLHEQGLHHVPDRGPVIYASNHIGWLDGPLLIARTPRPAHALAKREAFDSRSGVLLRLSGQIRLDRQARDVGALRRAAGALAAGQSVVVYPEGLRGAGDFASIRRGIGWLAAVSGAPVVPVVIVGTRLAGQDAETRAAKGARIDIAYGRPLLFPAQPWPRSRETVDDVTDQIHDHLRAHLQRTLTESSLQLPGPLPAGSSDG
ncbi:lysophospholipid acyltransferase family protein [Aeromicrobium sp. CTD01-1L150]|uniref:lysophospholipid acyltransferase family protein n=1 Tax=Aeromicrobium sp. CTD01-1L150 TaxID=3341830 RepID=UPI0035BF916B